MIEKRIPNVRLWSNDHFELEGVVHLVKQTAWNPKNLRTGYSTRCGISSFFVLGITAGHVSEAPVDCLVCIAEES